MRLSIITPSFRNAEWLKLCIASVADQRNVEVEHIVQDSCSDDGTQEWLAKDLRVRAFIEKDAGMYDAINRGLRRANGDILGYLNCDEQYLPGTLARVAAFFQAHPDVEVVFGDAVLIDADGKPLSYRRVVPPERNHVRWVHLNTLTCATFFRRELLSRGFYFDPQWKAIGDAVWVDRLLAEGVKVAVLPELLSAFAFTGSNLGASARANEEARAWQGKDWRQRLAPWYSLVHRLHNWRGGAYRPHALEIDLYAPSSPQERRHFSGTVGYGWPK